jgi:hypothetical protein
VVRLCLLVSLTISPLWADFWNWVTEGLLTNQSVTIGPYSYALPGVRIALWGGGIITFVAGLFAWRSIRRAERLTPTAADASSDRDTTVSFVPLGLVEPSPVAPPSTEPVSEPVTEPVTEKAETPPELETRSEPDARTEPDAETGT